MELLAVVVGITVAAVLYLLFLTRVRTYRIRYRPNPKPRRQGRSANRRGPDWEDMLD